MKTNVLKMLALFVAILLASWGMGKFCLMPESPPIITPDATLDGSADYFNIWFAPDGRTVASTCIRAMKGSATWSGPVRLWDLTTGAWRFTVFEDGRLVSNLGFSPDSRFFVAQDGAGLLQVWHTLTGELHLSVQTSRCPGVSQWRPCYRFTDDGQSLIFEASDEKSLTIIDLKSHERFTLEDSFRPFRLSADGKRLAAASHKQVKIWNLETRQAQVLKEQRPCLGFLAFSPDGTRLAASTLPDKDAKDAVNEIRLWDITQGIEQAQLPANGIVLALDFAADGHELFSSQDCWPVLWDVTTLPPRPLPALPRVGLAPMISPDWKRCLIGRGDSFVLCDLITGKELRSYPVSYPASGSSHASVEFSPDGKMIAASLSHYARRDGSTREILLLEAATGERLATIEASDYGSFSPDGARFVACGAPSAFRVFGVPAGSARLVPRWLIGLALTGVIWVSAWGLRRLSRRVYGVYMLSEAE